MNVYEIITNRILEQLEKGVVPWQKPWKTTMPRNLVSGKPYRGINILLLSLQDHGSAYWATFKQIKQAGGSVAKGSKSTPVVYWNMKEVEDKETGEKKEVPFMRYYRAFNLDQTEGIEKPEEEQNEVEPLEACENIVTGMPDKPAIFHNGMNRAYYSPVRDAIHLPLKSKFVSSGEYYSTLFHELIHSTGHSSRLNRKGITEMTSFGSEKYSKEELIAEIGSAFLCGQARIENKTINNSAAYVQSWLKELKSDKKLVVIAAAQAQKAVDWIYGSGEKEQAEA